MAFALTRTTGDGSTTTFNVPFSYRATADVVVKVAGVTKTITTHYTFPTSSSIQFTAGNIPANGTVVEIRRATSHNARLVDYVAGATLTETDLDTDSEQAFFISQEAIDYATDTIALNANDKFDALNKQVQNLADPALAQDAVTKNYLENTFLTPSDKTNLTAVAAVSTEMGRLGTTDAVADMAIIGTADFVADMNTVASTDFVNDLNTVASADFVADMNVLATADVVSDMNTLGTAANVTAMDTVAGSITNVNTNATNIASINTNATNISSINGAATQASNAATSATAAASSATAAASSSTSATSSETSATASAATATTKASEASTSAATATTKASESSTSAASALSDKNDAQTAKTAAETAQTAAAASQTAAASSATAAASSATSASSDATAAAASAASAAGNAGTQSVDRFNGNGSTTAFTMSASPATENNTMVYVDGVYQQKDTYSTSGTTLTFSEAPPTGTGNIEVMHMSTTPTGVTPTVAATNTTAAGGNASVTASGHALTFNIPRGDTGATGAASTVAGPQGPAGSDGADGSDGVFSAIASQAEAEAGSDNTKGMSPLRVAQSITANAGAGGATDINGLSDAKRQDTSTYGIGSNAFGSLSSGNGANNNLAVGNEAGGGLNGSGTNFPYANTFLGGDAGYGISQTGGTSESVAIGWRALQLHTGAYASTVCGKDAGKNISTGGSNTLYGHTAGDNITTGQNNLCLGRAADASSATVSNEITLGNGNITRFRIPALSLDHTATGLGIGGAPSHKLHVHGDIYSTGNVTAYSSAVAKDNITTIPDALDIVEQLRGVTFDWKESGKKAVGLIYEEVKEVIPELTSDNGGHVGVAYQNTVALLIEAVKSLSEKVKELESRNG